MIPSIYSEILSAESVTDKSLDNREKLSLERLVDRLQASFSGVKSSSFYCKTQLKAVIFRAVSNLVPRLFLKRKVTLSEHRGG